MFDRDLRIIGCNDSYLATVGRPNRADVVGRYLFEAFPSDPESDGHKLLKASFERVIATGRADELALLPYDISRPGEPPHLRFWSATHTPLFSSGGELRFILQHTTDVTELQALREESAFGLREGARVLRRAHKVQQVNLAMVAESNMLRSLFEQAPSFVAVLHGPDHVFQIANAAYRALVGGRDVLGLALRDALPEVVEQGFVELLDRVRETGEPFIGEQVPAILMGQRRILNFIYQPVLDNDGRVASILVQGHDLTSLVEAQEVVERQAKHLRLAQAAGGFGTFEWLVETGEIRASPEFSRLYGFATPDELTHVSQILPRIHPDDLALIASSRVDELEQALEAVEYRVVLDGEERWLSRQGTVIRDTKRGLTRVLGASQDITERKQWERQLETMAQESAHRVKNVLALAQAIVAQTLADAGSLEAGSRRVSERLAALAASQTALVDGSPTELDLGRLVRQTLDLVSGDARRLHIEGPLVRLDSRTALSLGLVLHELATNALKYGALSVPGGSVDIRWQISDDATLGELHWQEHGGPPVSEPGRAGFGLGLIRRSLGHDRRNRALVEFCPEGLRCDCTFALA